jgi:hypothetical protein
MMQFRGVCRYCDKLVVRGVSERWHTSDFDYYCRKSPDYSHLARRPDRRWQPRYVGLRALLARIVPDEKVPEEQYPQAQEVPESDNKQE